jgi:hypothetical protein
MRGADGTGGTEAWRNRFGLLPPLTANGGLDVGNPPVELLELN